MKRLFDPDALRGESALSDTPGFSPVTGGLGFRPAFFDFATHSLYLAPFAEGHPVAVRATLIAGFERNGFFYTRTAAARAAREWVSLA